MLTEEDRVRLRALQDRWLALGHVRDIIRRFGEDEVIAASFPGNIRWPTFREVRVLIHPDLAEWFRSFFREDEDV